MNIKYTHGNHVEKYELYLCSPNRKKICAIHADDTAQCVLRLNALSDLNLVVPMNIQTFDGETIKQPCYDLLESKRLVLVEGLGWFEITGASETIGEDGQYKTVKCSSHEKVLSSKGFACENRVYCFYNTEDPLDDNYNASDISAIPSIVGQLTKQAGIKLDLQKDDKASEKDYENWTITYIEPELKFNPFTQEGLCRTMEEIVSVGYDFMVNECSKAFEIIWLFDILHHSIQVKFVSNVTQKTDIYLSLKNLINSLEITENADDIITVLNCEGSNLDIRTVNPMGTNYICNFDYYKDKDGRWMSQELIDVLDEWEVEYNKNREPYRELVSVLKTQYLELSKMESTKQKTKLRITDLITARDKFLVNEALLAEIVNNGKQSLDINSSFYQTAFSQLENYTCYKTAPKAQTLNGVVTFYFGENDSQSNNSFIENYNNKYWYFIDDNNTTYCKLIQDVETKEIGFERYGSYNSIKDWCDCQETFGAIVAVEEVEVGEKSLDEKSAFYNQEFVKNGTDIFTCWENAPELIDGKFSGIGNNIENTLDICSGGEEGYLYLLDGDDTTYCKLKLSADINVEEQTATYYVSGFTRYTVINNLSKWINLQENKLSSVDTTELESQINGIQTDMQEIANTCNVLNFVVNKDTSGSLSKELDCYWVQGDYSNDTLSVDDDTEMSEIIELSEELLVAGEKQLKKVSQPKFTFTIEALDFIKNSNYKKFAKQLDLGRVIYVEKADGVVYTPAVTEYYFRLFTSEDFKLTFSNSARLDSSDFTFAELIAQNSKTSKSVSSNWQDLIKYAKEKEEISKLILNPLDLTLRASQNNMVNQEIIINTQGLLGRKYSDASHTTFEDEQIRIINNSILFTDNNWNSIKTALGKIYYENDDGSVVSSYGLIAETLIGELIMGETLKIRNTDSSIDVNAEGITIKNGDEVVFKANTNGSLTFGNKDSNNLFAFIIEEDKEGNKVAKMSANANYIEFNANQLVVNADNFTLTKDGIMKVGGYTVENDKLISGNIGMSSDETVGNIAFWAGNADKEKALFRVTNKGELHAESGNIGGLTISNTALSSNLFKLETGVYNNVTYSGMYFANSYSAEGVPNYTTVITNTGIEKAPYAVIDELSSNSFSAELVNVKGSLLAKQITINDNYSLTTTNVDTSGGSYVVKIFTDNSVGNARNTYGIMYKRVNGVDTETIYPFTKSFNVMLQSIISKEWHQYTITFTTNSSVSSKASPGWSFAISGAYLVDSGTTEYVFSAGEATSGVALIPTQSTYNYDLGTSSYTFRNIYARHYYLGSAAISSSDNNLKTDIDYDFDKYSKVFDDLKPASFKFIQSDSHRVHTGLIAQDLKQAIVKNGIDTGDFAAYCEWKLDNGALTCGIRYEELIPLNIYEIQKLKSRVKELEEKIEKLTNI